MLNISRRNTFLYFTVFWFVVSLIYFFGLGYISNGETASRLIDAITFLLFFLALGFVSKFPTKYISFESTKPLKIFFNHAIASLVVTAIWLELNYLILFELAKQSNEYYRFFIDTILWRAIIGILIYSVFVIFHYTLLYYEGYNEKLERESELKTSIIEAELRNLRFQINPHFIFNSLNSISSLTLTDPSRAREMTIQLSDFLRYALSKTESNFNTLREELKNINLYLNIEKIRFGDKFKYIQNVPDEFLDYEIPSMILQPIFENAIKHGVYESLEPIQIKLDCEKKEEHLSIRIENNFEPEVKQNKGEGVGLKNIKDRLKLIYGYDGLLSTQKENNIFIVEIFIPQISKGRNG